MTIIRIGLDTSKHVFQIHGVDENEKPVLRRQLRRSEVEKFFAQPLSQQQLDFASIALLWIGQGGQ